MGSTYELNKNYLSILKEIMKSGLNIYSECLCDLIFFKTSFISFFDKIFFFQNLHCHSILPRDQFFPRLYNSL